MNGQPTARYRNDGLAAKLRKKAKLTTALPNSLTFAEWKQKHSLPAYADN